MNDDFDKLIQRLVLGLLAVAQFGNIPFTQGKVADLDGAVSPQAKVVLGTVPLFTAVGLIALAIIYKIVSRIRSRRTPPCPAKAPSSRKTRSKTKKKPSTIGSK